MVASRSSFADRPSLNLTHRSGNRGVGAVFPGEINNFFCAFKYLLLMSLTYISGLTLSITQLTTFYRKMMSRGGGSERGIWEKTGDFAFTLPVRPGSILAFINHRHLTPHHFNKELFLEFNLGPQVD